MKKKVCTQTKKDIKWFRNALCYVSNRDADLYHEALKYADEIEEGCI